MNGIMAAAGEGDEPVEDTGVRPGLDRVGEASAAAGLGRDDLVGHAEDVLGDLVGDDDLLAGGLGEVPGVDQELDRQDAEGGAGGHLVRADLDLAVQAAGVPGLQRGLGRRGDPLPPGPSAAWAELGARGGAEERDRTDQVIGQLGDVELGADRRAVIVGFGDAAQDELADGQRRLGGA